MQVASCAEQCKPGGWLGVCMFKVSCMNVTKFNLLHDFRNCWRKSKNSLNLSPIRLYSGQSREVRLVVLRFSRTDLTCCFILPRYHLLNCSGLLLVCHTPQALYSLCYEVVLNPDWYGVFAEIVSKILQGQKYSSLTVNTFGKFSIGAVDDVLCCGVYSAQFICILEMKHYQRMVWQWLVDAQTWNQLHQHQLNFESS